MQILFDSVSEEPFMRHCPFDSLSGQERLLTNCLAPYSHYCFAVLFSVLFPSVSSNIRKK